MFNIPVKAADFKMSRFCHLEGMDENGFDMVLPECTKRWKRQTTPKTERPAKSCTFVSTNPQIPQQ
jgi:hypothetical protein